ncbi:MAG: hypothetical protein HYU30_05030 [Chloroflexi bacterium]|nr:hypothetical protein [Chloroflexota bacterium]
MNSTIEMERRRWLSLWYEAQALRQSAMSETIVESNGVAEVRRLVPKESFETSVATLAMAERLEAESNAAYWRMLHLLNPVK